jgi:hypothetical protein
VGHTHPREFTHLPSASVYPTSTRLKIYREFPAVPSTVTLTSVCTAHHPWMGRPYLCPAGHVALRKPCDSPSQFPHLQLWQ